MSTLGADPSGRDVAVEVVDNPRVDFTPLGKMPFRGMPLNVKETT